MLGQQFVTADFLRIKEVNFPVGKMLLVVASIHHHHIADGNLVGFALDFAPCLLVQFRGIGEPDENGIRIAEVLSRAVPYLLKECRHDDGLSCSRRRGKANRLRILLMPIGMGIFYFGMKFGKSRLLKGE